MGLKFNTSTIVKNQIIFTADFVSYYDHLPNCLCAYAFEISFISDLFVCVGACVGVCTHTLSGLQQRDLMISFKRLSAQLHHDKESNKVTSLSSESFTAVGDVVRMLSFVIPDVCRINNFNPFKMKKIFISFIGY